MSKLIKCPSCEKEISKSAKSCPNCGHQSMRSIRNKAIIVLIIVALFWLAKDFINSWEKSWLEEQAISAAKFEQELQDKEQARKEREERKRQLDELERQENLARQEEEERKEQERQMQERKQWFDGLSVYNMQPTGLLYEMFKFGSDYTNIQRENTENEMTGKVVNWTIKVSDIERKSGYYEVTLRDVGTADVDLEIYPTSEEDRQYIENLKRGDKLSFKGKVKGISKYMRNIEVSPAIVSENRQKINDSMKSLKDILALSPSPANNANHSIETLQKTPASALRTTGVLYDIFRGGEYTSVQQENAENLIKGQIVSWSNIVYEVYKRTGYYDITFQNKSDEVRVGLQITPTSPQDIQYIEGLKTGDKISFKGVIDRVGTKIEISPAILAVGGSASQSLTVQPVVPKKEQKAGHTISGNTIKVEPKSETKIGQSQQTKAEITSQPQQVQPKVVVENPQSEASEYQKIVEWIQAQESVLAQAQSALQALIASGDTAQITEYLNVFADQVDNVLESLDAVDVKSEAIVQLKNKTKETLILSNELLVESAKLMLTPTEEGNKAIQEKIQILIKSGEELQKLQEQLKQKFMPSSKVNSSEGIMVKRPDTSYTNIPLADLKFNEGLAVFEDSSTGLKGYVDGNGKVVIKPQFTGAGGFYQGRAVVKNTRNEWGYIDKSGNWVISPQFCMAGRFSEGLAAVYVGATRDANGDCVQGKWGFISVTGKMVIAPQFEQVWRFDRAKNEAAKAKVVLDGYTGYINGKGEWVD